MGLDLSKTTLGIELGSTRIKAVLIDENFRVIADGEHYWESTFENQIWTYALDDMWDGLQNAYKNLKEEVLHKYNIPLTTVGAIGISGMMHGYLPFDKDGNKLARFRTWRNTITEEAANKLSELFQFTIPQRWSVAHLYQSILKEEKHVKKIDFLTTLSAYVHWQLTDKKVIGIGEASGMFPIDIQTNNYDKHMLKKFEHLIEEKDYHWTLKDILPRVKSAGEQAGHLTEKGAKLLDPSGVLQPGIPLCPPEGDAGTGMVATNSVSEHTGNISAGTSIFAMIVLQDYLSDFYKEINIVTTPDGKPVAMVHCNNFTSDINAWVDMFEELFQLMGSSVDKSELFTLLFKQALHADENLGGLASCNYYSGEAITEFDEGRPLFVRMPDSRLNIANFIKTKIYTALATLKIGMDILKKEGVKVENIYGHGGFFKTEKVGQQIMADALNIPVSVMEVAGDGGPWGMAILAAYSLRKKKEQTLDEFLRKEIFGDKESKKKYPLPKGVKQFDNYMDKFKRVLEIERNAIELLR